MAAVGVEQEPDVTSLVLKICTLRLTAGGCEAPAHGGGRALPGKAGVVINPRERPLSASGQCLSARRLCLSPRQSQPHTPRAVCRIRCPRQ